MYSQPKNVLLKRVQELEKLLSEKDLTLSSQELKLQAQKQRIAYLERLVFGQKRERYEAPAQSQLNLFEVNAAEVSEAVEEKQKKENPPKPKRKPHPGRYKLPENLEVRETIIQPDAVLTDMIEIGKEITNILEVEPAKYFIHRIIRPKYAPKSGEGSFIIAPLPERINNKSIAGASIISQAITDKYVDHLPILRQVQRLARYGIEINQASLYNWVQQGLRSLQILYEYLWEWQVRCRYLQVDETTIKVLESNKPKAAHLGYYWVYNDPVNKITMFKYEKGRSGAFPTRQLKDFKGYLQTDGYAGYNALAKKQNITHLACWAHARREFERALDNDRPRAAMALEWIQQLYQVEKQTQNLSSQERKKQRLSKSLPLCNAFFKWAAQNEKHTLPQSQIGKAFRYVINRYDALMNYLYDGQLKIDNNSIENTIRPVAIGRKNYLFAKNHETAQNAAIIYTFMAICKAHQVNPHHWLTHTFENISETKLSVTIQVSEYTNFGKVNFHQRYPHSV